MTSLNKPHTEDDCCSRDDGVRACRGSPCVICNSPAVVLHGRLIALAHPAGSFTLALVDAQFQSVSLLPRPKNKIFLAACGVDLKNKRSRSGRVKSSLSLPSTLSRPPSSSNPASWRRSSLHSNQECAVVWLVVAPVSAHEHPD